jgi:hypothetical protein
MRSSSRLLALVIASVLIAACSSALGPGSSGSPASPSAVPSSPSPSAAPSSPSPVPSPAPSGDPDSIVEIVTTIADDGLRVRSQPRIGGDSQMLEPLLPIGTALLVLQGPVSASGYQWFEVVPLTSRDLPSGWIASADRDGEPWVEDGEFDCPAAPADMATLAELPRGVGLACFAGTPITVEARLLPCNCDADGSWYTPDWFYLGSGSPVLLVAPDVTTVPSDFDDWFALNLDPAADQPDVLPAGEVVEVTGTFDHPAAATCTRTEMDGQPAPSQGCRLEFAVTQLLLFGP